MNPLVRIGDEEIDPATALREADVIEAAPGIYSVIWNGRSFDVRVAGRFVIVNGTQFEAEVIDPRELRDSSSGASAHGRAEIISPMPGKVIRLLVEEGQEVEAGQGIVVVEAMKMQNEMASPRSGKVTSVRAVAGAAVAAGEVLAVVE